MSKSTVVTLIGGLVLLGFMLIQNNLQSNLTANFNEFQSKRNEIVKKQFIDSGINEYQAHLIADAIREESFMLRSTIFSYEMMQTYTNMMGGLVLLMLIANFLKNEKKNDESAK